MVTGQIDTCISDQKEHLLQESLIWNSVELKPVDLALERAIL